MSAINIIDTIVNKSLDANEAVNLVNGYLRANKTFARVYVRTGITLNEQNQQQGREEIVLWLEDYGVEISGRRSITSPLLWIERKGLTGLSMLYEECGARKAWV